MTNLTDLQSLLLATAASRDSGVSSRCRPPSRPPPRASRKSLASLITKALAEEREIIDPTPVHRSDGDFRYGLFITAAGKQAIGVIDGDGREGGAVAPAANLVGAPARISKAATELTLLQRVEGATIPELIAVTGWLPHTTRAALTGLRKKGHVLDKSKRDGATCYRVAAA